MTLKQLFTLHFKDLPEKRQLNFQDPSSPIMEQIIILHDYTMFILTAILIFILWLLIKTSTNIIYWRNMNENTKLEIVWTTLPAIILTTIAYPSLKLLYATDEPIEPELTILGNQYIDHTNTQIYKQIEFTSYMIPTEDRRKQSCTRSRQPINHTN